NQLTLRSPDPYEFKNWKESFAVNLEYFVLDPEFACRRPAVHAFYAQHFGYDPHPSRTCKPQTTLTLASEFGSGKVNVADINPDRVYEIHALFAGRGPQVMSKWGHSLYRIVVCAPDRKQVGPECLNDITHHVAISFRANVSDASISYLKGLSGDYPSLLFAQSLLSVIEEYNKNEFRELTSLPLRLNQQEKNFFLYRTLEAFWEYGGRYKFITNNCATEALNFLKGTLGETRLNSAHPLSPLGLHKTLQKLGVVDATVLQNPQQAAEKGYFYGSKKPEVEMAFAGVQKSATLQGVAFPKDVDQYLEKTSAEQRRLWFTTLEPSRGETRQVQASRFFLLESYVARRANSAYNKRIAKVIEANRFDGLPQEAVESAGKIRAALSRLREIQQLSLPSSIQSDGYGIPISRSESSSEEPAVSVPPELLAEQRKLAQQVIEWAKVAFSTWIGEIEAIQKNRLQFLREMREQRKPPNQTGGPGSLN
ncbi:DUF4105 domain-containing protein, partial [bacterium]|nr:DUF4105 domain-containing protein [bacterium]